MNNKGFVFIETIIVICVLTVALITLYNNYSNIVANTKELNTFDTTEYNYKTYNLMKKYNVGDLTDGECIEKDSEFSDTGKVKICKFGNILEETGLINPNNETLLLDAIMRDNVVSSPKTTPGREVSLETEAVLATTEDDYGTSYYFRGNVTNNYVNYSGMCWRVVRVQGDKNIKIVLADRNGGCNASTYSVDNGDSAFIASATQWFCYKDNHANFASSLEYIGSDVEQILNSWMGISENRNYTYHIKNIGAKEGTFTNELIDTSKLVEADWCGDFSVEDKGGHYSGKAIYGIHKRLHNLPTASPTLKCDMIGSQDGTAKKFKKIIGLLTADEVAFAGATYYNDNYSNLSYFLQTNAIDNSYWTITPYEWYQPGGSVSIEYVLSYGITSTQTDECRSSIRPAVVLNKDVTISSGNGTQTNSYVISTYVDEESSELSSVEIYIRNHKDQMDAYIIDYLLKQDLNKDNDSLYLVEYKKEDKQNPGKYFTYISSLTY